MEKKKTGAFNLGGRGFLMVILAFFSCYMYSTLTSDSLNVTVSAFGAMGLNVNAMYALVTISAFIGIVTSIIWGKLMSVNTASKMWAAAMLITGVFSILWSFASNMVIYAIGYLVCYACTLASAQLLGYQVLAYWFPRKRGVALGISTAGFPLSAATTTAITSGVLGATGKIGNYYIIMGVVSLIVGALILVFAKDFPEEVGCYPDNDKDFDFETEKKRHQENLEYVKNSKWTVAKCLTTGRMWVLWVAIGVTGFLSMGIMANFMNKFLETGYTPDQIIPMLAIAGIIAIPGSMFVGWLDVKIGTKKAGILVNAAAIIAVGFNLTSISALHYLSLPILACMLGGSSNLMVSCTSAIWGRYDFQNAFRVIQPLNSLMTGVGITVVGIIGTNISYWAAYAFMFGLAIAGLVAMIALKLEPIDADVR